jgi:thymidylate synthase
MIHRDMPGGLEDLQEYVLEVLDGIKDHLVRRSADDTDDTRWEYTYHQRLFSYAVPGQERLFDQIELVAQKLAATPHTRRAQAITWNPKLDPPTDDPPCLQRIWGRLVEDENGGLTFNMNTHWRSRDLFKAWFENVIALTTLMRKIAAAISERASRPVAVGRYVDVSDSLHIYGSYFRELEGIPERGIKSFFEKLESRSFEDRTWSSEFVRPHFIDDGVGKGLRPLLAREKDMPVEVRAAIAKELEAMEQEGHPV